MGLFIPMLRRFTLHVRWCRFSSEPRFLTMLDDIYEQAIPLIDVVVPLLHPVSGIEDLSAKWEEIKLKAETDQNAAMPGRLAGQAAES